MICYLDKTFCSFYKECVHGDICRYALTDKIKNAAKKAGLHISQYAVEPNCFKI
jgi:hypothetical protein